MIGSNNYGIELQKKFFLSLKIIASGLEFKIDMHGFFLQRKTTGMDLGIAAFEIL
jgi:hypothetical protein